MTPRSSCPREEYHSSPGRKPPAHYRINTVAENCAGGELAATSPGQARRGRGSATDCLGHFWQADLGHFSRAPKNNGTAPKKPCPSWGECSVKFRTPTWPQGASSLIGENWNGKSRSAGDCDSGPA